MNKREFCDEQRAEKQEEFLKELATNIDEVNSIGKIYTRLAFYGMSDEEKIKSVQTERVYDSSGIFLADEQIDLYKNSVNLKKRLGEEYEQINFTRLKYRDYFMVLEKKWYSIRQYIKDLVPLTPELKIYMAPNFYKDEEAYINFVKSYLNFLEENDIKHSSKISSGMRADHLVTRVHDLETATKISEFVNTYSDDNLLFNENNPFLVNVGKLSLAFDQRESFNSLLSYYLYHYIINCRDFNMLDTVSIANFRIFVENHFQETIVNFVGFENFFDNKDAPAAIRYFSKPQVMANISQSTIMLIKTLGKNVDLNGLTEIYNSMHTPEYIEFVSTLKEKFAVCKETYYQKKEEEEFSKTKII